MKRITTLSVDIGTSYMKCAVVSHTHATVGFNVEIQHTIPLTTKDDAPDVEGWFLLLMQWIKNLPAETLMVIQGITIFGQGPTLVGVDSDGAFLPPAVLRTTLYDTTYGVDSSDLLSYFLPLAFWYKQRYPLQYNKARWCMPIPEYFAYRLCEVPTAVYPNRRYKEYYWSRDSIRQMGLDVDKFPPLKPLDSRIGTITQEVARFTNLKAGTAVIGGGIDFAMSIIGTNSLYYDAICDSAGNSQGLNFCAKEPAKNVLIHGLPHIVKGWNNSTIIEGSGAIYQKAIEHLASHPYDPSQMRNDPIIPRVFHIGYVDFPPEHNPQHNKEVDIMAVAESLMFVQRYFIQEVKLLYKPDTIELYICGGQSYHSGWNQLKSTLTGATCKRMQCHNSELIGGAVAALSGLGVYSSIKKGASYIGEAAITYQPDLEIAPEVTERYSEFQAQFYQYILKCAKYL